MYAGPIDHSPYAHIICKPANTLGCDKIIGDVHGNVRCLEAVLKTLSEHDRLFIVGDLVDKGDHNVEVIDLLLHNRDRVFSIRGNHEDLCLRTISILEKCVQNSVLAMQLLHKKHLCTYLLVESNIDTFMCFFGQLFFHRSTEIEDMLYDLKSHCKNQGKWLIKLFQSEFKSKKIKITHNSEESLHVHYDDDSQIKKIKEYIAQLPYMIKINGIDPFCLVHADMPFGDDELAYRIRTQHTTLSPDEIKHATWARAEGCKASLAYRSKHSLPTFVGHTIIEKETVAPVREATNIYNIDVGTYYNDTFLIVDATKKTTVFLGLMPIIHIVSISVSEDKAALLQFNFNNPDICRHCLVKQGDQIFYIRNEDAVCQLFPLQSDCSSIAFPDIGVPPTLVKEGDLTACLQREIMQYNVSIRLRFARCQIQKHLSAWGQPTVFDIVDSASAIFSEQVQHDEAMMVDSKSYVGQFTLE